MIFLDMDGVLCDFVSAAFAAHRLTFDPATYPRGLFACEEFIGCTANEFWEPIHAQGEEFWNNLEPYPWANQLVRELERRPEGLIIATSPSRHHGSYSGKQLWLKRMGFNHIDSMFGKSKHLMARPGRILIDDGEHNTKPWVEEGGHVVLVPQPWNHAQQIKPDAMVDYILSGLPKI